jgi:hypothetical protein
MEPKEKAKELVDKMMYHLNYNCQPTLSEMVAKQCALIAVDEILSVVWYVPIDIEYWQEVKQEIENL